jgi:ABC-type polysaccharide/polyol phosphate export permease
MFVLSLKKWEFEIMNSRVRTFLSEFSGSLNIQQQLVVQQLVLRYRRTTLGFLWTLVNPLMMISIMAVVFSTLFKEDLKVFALTLFAGMIPWNFLNSVATQSCTAFVHNESLIKKIYLPKVIFPSSIVFALLVDSLLSFLVLFCVILVLGGTFSWALLFLPISFLLLFFFAFGIALIMSIATVFFRDLKHVIVLMMQALFYLSPVLYKPESLSGGLSFLVAINPVTPFIALFRVPLVNGTLPSINIILHSIGFTVISIALGMYIFIRQEKQIIFRL